jgi:hypothetical protein
MRTDRQRDGQTDWKKTNRWFFAILIAKASKNFVQDILHSAAPWTVPPGAAAPLGTIPPPPSTPLDGVTFDQTNYRIYLI